MRNIGPLHGDTLAHHAQPLPAKKSTPNLRSFSFLNSMLFLYIITKFSFMSYHRFLYSNNFPSGVVIAKGAAQMLSRYLTQHAAWDIRREDLE